ncbi:MAG: hypothetical protein HY271_20170 [Deltaproteobacteria bacterium]|nr:hypothetical protein [Deltaproteobacteria bacterium]
MTAEGGAKGTILVAEDEAAVRESLDEVMLGAELVRPAAIDPPVAGSVAAPY